MPQGPYGEDPGRGGLTLEPQGLPVQNFFQPGGWGPNPPFGPLHQFGPGPIPNIPMYESEGVPDITTQLAQPRSRPIDQLLPPQLCPTECPTPVRADLCLPSRPGSWSSDTDPFGDPAEFVPPGVRTVPEYTPSGVKSVPGGKALVGPGGEFVFPTPKLPGAPRGYVVAAGERVGGTGSAVAAGPGRFRMPWWGWAVAAVVALKVLGGRR